MDISAATPAAGPIAATTGAIQQHDSAVPAAVTDVTNSTGPSATSTTAASAVAPDAPDDEVGGVPAAAVSTGVGAAAASAVAASAAIDNDVPATEARTRASPAPATTNAASGTAAGAFVPDIPAEDIPVTAKPSATSAIAAGTTDSDVLATAAPAAANVSTAACPDAVSVPTAEMDHEDPDEEHFSHLTPIPSRFAVRRLGRDQAFLQKKKHDGVLPTVDGSRIISDFSEKDWSAFRVGSCSKRSPKHQVEADFKDPDPVTQAIMHRLRECAARSGGTVKSMSRSPWCCSRTESITQGHYIWLPPVQDELHPRAFIIGLRPEVAHQFLPILVSSCGQETPLTDAMLYCVDHNGWSWWFLIMRTCCANRVLPTDALYSSLITVEMETTSNNTHM